MDLTAGNRLLFLFGFPVIIILMLYISALIGFKWQGAWVRSPVYSMVSRSPRPLRLAAAGAAGAVTPFCSCTTVPAFAAIIESELGLDTAMAFLIASPLIDPAGIILLVLMFGIKLTAVYVAGCFAAAVSGGWILGRVFSVRDINPALLFGCIEDSGNITWRQSSSHAWSYISKFWWVVVLSTLIGFLIYDYVPSGLVASYSSFGTNAAVPAAAVTGVFVYAHFAVLVPVGTALLTKGIAPGIVLAFLASSAGISPPEIVLLSKLLSFRLTVSYIAVTLTLISLMGLIANMIGT